MFPPGWKYAFLTSRSDISVESISHMVVDVPTMLVNVSVGRDSLTSRSDVSAG